MNSDIGWIKGRQEAGTHVFELGGRWSLEHLSAVVPTARAALPAAKATERARIDLTGVDYLDPSGAWLVADTARRLAGLGYAVEYAGGKPADRQLLERVDTALKKGGPPVPAKLPPLIAALASTGKTVIDAGGKAKQLVNFFGFTVVLLGRAIAKPWRINFKATAKHIETTGFNALPIVGLLAFLIGMVIAFMGAVQLKKFGAEIFTVNLVGIAVLRELGVLITSILIAGRSGSAFTAQIGTMKVNQEIDAMQTIGLNPVEILVLPRILAMMVTLPLLTFYADIMGLAGGAVMSMTSLDISLETFVRQLQGAVDIDTFLIGFLKAPLFAYIIAMVGCFEGLQVSGSAESVGARTTMSVVEAIFLVIALDAVIAITLSALGI